MAFSNGDLLLPHGRRTVMLVMTNNSDHKDSGAGSTLRIVVQKANPTTNHNGFSKWHLTVITITVILKMVIARTVAL
eukprot:1815988-Ditylum_brightwellii.AAC.1